MLKKIFCTIFILALFCTATDAAAYKAPDMIRVGLYFGSESKSSFTAEADGKALIGYVQDRDFNPLYTIDESEVIVEKGGGAYLRTKQSYETLDEVLLMAKKLREDDVYAYGAYIDGENYLVFGLYDSVDEAKKSLSDLEFTELELVATELDTKAVMVSAKGFNMVFRDDEVSFAIGADEKKTVSVSGREYYGYIVADRIYSNDIAIINLVSSDDYVACVVGSEMYSTWHIEALKAQAVIARTYAMTSTSYKNYGIDVTDDTRSQAYYGLERETESTRRAADETSNMILLYKDKPAQTFFYSSSGGKTADVYSAWGGGAGLDYLKSVDDTYEDSENVGVWSVTYTAEEVAKKLAAAGVDIGTVTDIKVTERGENDERVRKLVFEGTNGSHTVKFEKCRTILGLKSQYYYIRQEYTEEKNIAVLGADGEGAVKLGNISVLSSDKTSQLGGNVSVLGKNGTQHISVATEEKKDSFTFDGRGYGHGVGLSQYGAKGMAEAGFKFDEILFHYYVGTTLSK